MESKERVFWLDVIRAIACICVALSHFNYNISNGFILNNGVFLSFPLDMYIGTIGVNLFFMISGSTLMLVRLKKGREPLHKFYYKRFEALYPMYWIAWFSATCISFFYWRHMPSDGIWWILDAISGFNGYLYTLNITPFAFYQVGEWFLGCIVCLYIFSPLLLSGIEKKPKITLIVSFILYMLLFLLKIPPKFFVMYIPHMLLGMMVIKYIEKVNWKICFILFFIGTLTYFVPGRQRDGSIYSFVMCSCIFVWLIKLTNFVNCSFLKAVFSWIAKYSYAVFLVHHKLIILLIQRFDLPNLAKRDVWLLFIIFCLLTALLSRWLYQLTDYMVKLVKKSYRIRRY